MAAVQSSAFLLTSATVMIGAYGTDVFSLTPSANSVGMVKNVKIGMTSNELSLLNGIQQLKVDSLKSGVALTVGFEGYEFSAANLQLALGFAGTTIQYKRGVLTAPLTAASTSLSYATNPVPGETATGLATAGDVPASSTLLIQSASGTDLVFPVKTVGATTLSTGTFTSTIPAVPAGMGFAAGDNVWIANTLSLGDTTPMSFYCMKVAGVMSGSNKPVVGIFPKIKIIKGFEVNMSETAYGNMPFEITPYFLTGAEITGRLGEIGTTSQGKFYTAG